MELFEIIVILCVGKLKGHSDTEGILPKKDKLP